MIENLKEELKNACSHPTFNNYLNIDVRTPMARTKDCEPGIYYTYIEKLQDDLDVFITSFKLARRETIDRERNLKEYYNELEISGIAIPERPVIIARNKPKLKYDSQLRDLKKKIIAITAACYEVVTNKKAVINSTYKGYDIEEFNLTMPFNKLLIFIFDNYNIDKGGVRNAINLLKETEPFLKDLRNPATN